jgi:hypothetical protein
MSFPSFVAESVDPRHSTPVAGVAFLSPVAAILAVLIDFLSNMGADEVRLPGMWCAATRLTSGGHRVPSA